MLLVSKKVDFNRRYAIVFEKSETRDNLVENGLDVGDVHLTFAYHKKKRV